MPEPSAAVPGVALIGAGNVVNVLYLPLLGGPGPPFRVHAVYDPDRAAAGRVAAALDARAVTSVEMALDHPGVTVAFVCTPPWAHREIVLAAVVRGRHVLCEKPMAANGDEADEMVIAAEKAGVRHMVNFTYRFRPGPSAALRLIEQGALGRIHHVRGALCQGQWFRVDGSPAYERSDATAWRYGPWGGVVRDLAPHLVDLYGAIGPVEWVQACRATLREAEDDAEDVCGVALGLGGGLAQLLVSRWATGPREIFEVEVSGSAGSLRFNRDTAQVWLRGDDSWRPVPSPPRPTFLDAFRSAIDGVDDGRVPTFRKGASTSRILDAILSSGRSGAVVAL